jgi:hypothetical protein
MRCFHRVDDNMSVGHHVTATTAFNEFRYGLNLVLIDPRTPPGYFAMGEGGGQKMCFQTYVQTAENYFY